MQLINFVLPSLHSSLTGGHLNATELQAKIKSFNKGEGYYCLFDLEPRDSFKEYRGVQSPALGYFVLDFDSSEDMDNAKNDCLTVISSLHLQPDTFKVFFSGNKGFHLYIRQEFFNIPANDRTAKSFEAIATELGKRFNLNTLDDSIYQANRKFRIPNSQHQKTGLHKIEIDWRRLESLTIDEIKNLAKTPQKLTLFDYSLPTTKYTKAVYKKEDGSVNLYGLDAVTDKDISSGGSGDFATFKDKVCISSMQGSKHKEGMRHEVALTLISEYFHQGLTQPETEERLLSYCKTNSIEERFNRDYKRAIKDIYNGGTEYKFGCYSKIKQKCCSGTCGLYPRLDPYKRAEVTDSPVPASSLNRVSEGSGGAVDSNLSKKEQRELEKKQKAEEKRRAYLQSLPVSTFKEWGDKGPKCTISNVQHMLEALSIDVRYDVIKKNIHIEIPNSKFLIDTELNDKMNFIVSLAISCDMNYGKIEDFVSFIGAKNPYNPVARWVDERPWDGVDRLQAFFDTVTGANDHVDEERLFKETLLRRWMISAIAAAYSPNGIQAHGVLVFTGAQYMGKTNWFKSLAPESLQVLKDGAILDPKDKDSVYQAVSNWLVELGEIDSTFRKSDIAQLKAFITKDKDTVRLPYRREPASFARRTVFFGSVNDNEYLNDPTGNRRFWTIKCEKLNFNHGLDMQQIWAQVLSLYDAGEPWWLSKEEMDKLNILNQDFETEDPVAFKLKEKFEHSEGSLLSATEIAELLGYTFPQQRDLRAIGRAIKKVFNLNAERIDVKRGYRIKPIDGSVDVRDSAQENPF